MSKALEAIASLFLNATALAQRNGVTSGPAARGTVVSSTVIQKMYEGRSSADGHDMLRVLEEGGAATGFPGVEGKPGVGSGQVSPGGKIVD